MTVHAVKGTSNEHGFDCFICVCDMQELVKELLNKPAWIGRHANVPYTLTGARVFVRNQVLRNIIVCPIKIQLSFMPVCRNTCDVLPYTYHEARNHSLFS